MTDGGADGGARGQVVAREPGRNGVEAAWPEVISPAKMDGGRMALGDSPSCKGTEALSHGQFWASNDGKDVLSPRQFWPVAKDGRC